MRQKLNLITLGVDDFNRALNFYENGLGWKKSDKSMDGLALSHWVVWCWLCTHDMNWLKTSPWNISPLNFRHDYLL